MSFCFLEPLVLFYKKEQNGACKACQGCQQRRGEKDIQDLLGLSAQCSSLMMVRMWAVLGYGHSVVPEVGLVL